MTSIDDDAIFAVADLVARTGAREFMIGHLNDDPPHQWYAHAQFRGARIGTEDHPGPVEAADALARRLLDGARCTHCGGLVALSNHGAYAHPSLMVDGTRWTAEQIAAAGQCRWRRMGNRWTRGCEATHPEGQRTAAGPNRAQRRRANKR